MRSLPKDFAKNEEENQHTKNAIELVKMFGTSAEDIKINVIKDGQT